MITKAELIEKLEFFICEFKRVNKKFQEKKMLPEEGETVIEAYTEYILNKENSEIWEQSVNLEDAKIQSYVSEIQRESAQCVYNMEKVRADELINNNADITNYFKNIENCILDEFGKFKINLESKVLLIGIGSFPMTPLIIGQKTGAKIVGIDIDEESVSYAKKVIKILGNNLKITATTQSYLDLDFTKEATHIIIASTIPEKIDILHNLHSLTNKNTIISMRYGNGFKSLFNYPLINVSEELWKKVDDISYSMNVFDIALFQKQDN